MANNIFQRAKAYCKAHPRTSYQDAIKKVSGVGKRKPSVKGPTTKTSSTRKIKVKIKPKNGSGTITIGKSFDLFGRKKKAAAAEKKRKDDYARDYNAKLWPAGKKTLTLAEMRKRGMIVNGTKEPIKKAVKSIEKALGIKGVPQGKKSNDLKSGMKRSGLTMPHGYAVESRIHGIGAISLDKVKHELMHQASLMKDI